MTFALCPSCHDDLHANRSAYREPEAMALQATLVELKGPEEAAKASEEFNDNLTRLSSTVSGIAYSIGNELIPEINNLIDAWLDYNKRVKETPSIFEQMWEKLKFPRPKMPGDLGKELMPEIPLGLKPPKKPFGGEGEEEAITADIVPSPERISYESFMKEYENLFPVDKSYDEFMAKYHETIENMKDESAQQKEMFDPDAMTTLATAWRTLQVAHENFGKLEEIRKKTVELKKQESEIASVVSR